MTEQELTAWLEDWYDRWSGPGEYWTFEGLAIGLTDAFTVAPRDLETAVRLAKVRAGLNPDDAYPPSGFIDHLDEEWHRPFWDRQIDRVVEASKANTESTDPAHTSRNQPPTEGEDQ